MKGKRKKQDVQEFGRDLMENILSLHTDLARKTYVHGGYCAFKINDPKPRDIHKASVRDRLLHHGIYRKLYPFFEPTFIADSYSCRLKKGTHKALERFKRFAYRESKNNTRKLWVLKCDIRKFFASIDQAALMDVLRSHVADEDIRWLISRVLVSFRSTASGKGLPLGNLTSQLLVNVYMSEFDHFAKHSLKARSYIRYADDFVVMSPDKQWLTTLVPRIEEFLSERLKLHLHPQKVSIRTLASGVDFLGWVHFPDHRVLRGATARRIFRNLAQNHELSRATSYQGMLLHGNARKISSRIRELMSQTSA